MEQLGINQTKYIQDQHVEKYKILINKIKEKLYKWREFLCSWTGRHDIIKMSALPNLIYTFNTISFKISACDFLHGDR